MTTLATPHHEPAMLAETLELLMLRPGMTVVDGTLGLAGHSLEFVKAIAPGGTLGLLASFADARGKLCREMQLFFASDTAFEHAVACTSGEGWVVEIVVSETAEPAEEGRFVPAAGPGDRAIEGLLDAIGAGLALAPEEEAAARGRGWRL